METAPRDGSVIKLRGVEGGQIEGRWTISSDALKERDMIPGWFTDNDPNEPISIFVGFGWREPIGWMPLTEQSVNLSVDVAERGATESDRRASTKPQ